MKKILANLALLFKNLGFIYRIIGLVITSYLVRYEVIPDLSFQISKGKMIEISFDELVTMNREDIPRYLKVKDAIVPAGTYVETRKGENKELTGIYYPVYPMNDATIGQILGVDSVRVISEASGDTSWLKTTSKVAAQLVIKDWQVKESDLSEGGNYFNSDNFTIEGKYDGDGVASDIRDLLVSSGVDISPNAIVLQRGSHGLGLSDAIGLTIAGILLIIIGLLSFIPTNILRSWL